MSIFPSTVARVPSWAAAVERWAEPVGLVAGAVVLDLVRRRFSAARGR